LFQAAPLPARGGAFELHVEFVPTGWALLAALTAASWAAWAAALAREAGVA
jgi:hypothetical protein